MDSERKESAPSYVVTQSLSRWQLARRYRAKYSLTVERGGWVARYYSETPCVAKGEAWFDALNKEDVTQWALIEVEEGQEHALLMWVRDGVIREIKTLPLNEVDSFHLALCEVVYTTHPQGKTLWPHYEVKVVSPPMAPAPALRPNRTQPYLLAAALALSAVTAIGVVTQKPTEAVRAPVVVSSPYQAYQNTMRQALSASEALSHAVALTARGEFAPAGWSLQSVELNERKVSARVERDSGGRLDVMNVWLSEQPDMHAKVAPNESTLWLPVTTTLQPWTDKLASAQAHYDLLDSLTGLGWSLVEASAQIKSPTREHQWSLTKAGTLSELASLSTLLSNQPASLQALTLAPLHDGTYRVELTLTYTQRQSKENKT